MWKENLISEMERKMKMNEVELPDDLEHLNTMEYQSVVLRGHFIHDREIYVGPRSLITPKGDMHDGGGGVFSKQSSTTGFLVITPFKLENREETILVNRGWVSKDIKNPEARREGQIEGTVEIKGIVRLDEPRPQFTPNHRGNLFFYRDLLKMSSLTFSDPFFVDQKFDPSLPQKAPIGGQTRVSLRNEHLSYVITWYSLSAFTAFLWWRRIVTKVAF